MMLKGCFKGRLFGRVLYEVHSEKVELLHPLLCLSLKNTTD